VAGSIPDMTVTMGTSMCIYSLILFPAEMKSKNYLSVADIEM
jgi:hypothetical protein